MFVLIVLFEGSTAEHLATITNNRKENSFLRILIFLQVYLHTIYLTCLRLVEYLQLFIGFNGVPLPLTFRTIRIPPHSLVDGISTYTKSDGAAPSHVLVGHAK